MLTTLLLWFIIFVLNACELFLLIFSLVSLSDLEHDYLNPTDLCDRLNPLHVPEYILHAAITLLMLVQRSWLVVALNVPLLYWHIKTYLSKKHLLDPTSIFSDMPKQYRIRYVKIAFYLLNFFYCMYCLIMAFIGDFLSKNPSDGMKVLSSWLEQQLPDLLAF
mmetsp:Transcript_10380/g.16936  ORF Transcript_10380/g.16936 Transcript_10380/m.16936 type:complete len:163 (+) Transcript_10380:146-634(+)